jgi:hypothetical protein
VHPLLLLLLSPIALAAPSPGDADAPQAKARTPFPLHGGVSTSFTGWTGPVAADGSAFNPGAQLAVRPRVVVSDGPWTLMGFWGVSRTLQGCDVCDDPTTAGGTDARYQPLRALDSDDLTVSIARSLGGGGGQQQLNPLLATTLGATSGEEEGPRSGPLSSLRANLRTDVVLPASRDALVCNPFYGAVGVGTVLSVAAGRTMVSASGSARRSFFRYDAVPVGLPGCAQPLDAPVDTLAGAVDPTPWQGARSAGANALGAASTRLAWQNLHRLLGEGKVATALTTQASIGLNTSVRRQADATSVDTLAGPVDVEAGRHPWTTQVPMSLTAGWNVSRPLTLALTVSNAVPGMLTDPGATFRNLPSQTAATFTADAHW